MHSQEAIEERSDASNQVEAVPSEPEEVSLPSRPAHSRVRVCEGVRNGEPFASVIVDE